MKVKDKKKARKQTHHRFPVILYPRDLQRHLSSPSHLGFDITMSALTRKLISRAKIYKSKVETYLHVLSGLSMEGNPHAFFCSLQRSLFLIRVVFYAVQVLLLRLRILRWRSVRCVGICVGGLHISKRVSLTKDQMSWAH
jgi:hypothetical protein